MTEALLKELNIVKNGDIDMTVIDKFVDEFIDDAKWRKVLKNACNDCYKRLKPKMQEIRAKMEAAPFNIKKEDCDVKFMAFSTCVTFEKFLVNFHRNFELNADIDNLL